MNRLLSFEEYGGMLQENRPLVQRVFFVFALVSLVLNYAYGLSISQIEGNPLLYQDVDPTYWLFMLLNIPEIVGTQFPVLFDLVLFLSCFASVLWPKQWISCLVFFIFHFIYFVVYNMMAGHHYHNVGLLFMSFPFIFSGRRTYVFSFTFMRFVFCFMMFTAAAWKIFRGNLTYPDQLYSLMVAHHADNLLRPETDWHLAISGFFLQSRMLLHGLWVTMIIMEVVFVLGFFTFRFDRLLLACYLLFFAGGWILLDIYNYENLLFLMTLAPVLLFIKRFAKVST